MGKKANETQGSLGPRASGLPPRPSSGPLEHGLQRRPSEGADGHGCGSSPLVPQCPVPPGPLAGPWRGRHFGTGHLVRRTHEAPESPGPQATSPRPPFPGKPTFCAPTTAPFGDAVGEGKPQAPSAPRA